MTEFSSLDAVIFDMDGLMLDSEPLAKRAWSKALAESGLSIDDALYLEVVGRSVPDTKQIFCSALGAGFVFDDVYARQHGYFEDIIAREGIPLKPGLCELLAWLEGHGVPKALASSTPRAGVLARLQRVGLDECFPVIVAGDDIQHSKPAPDIFLAAAELLGVSPAHCVVLEDSESGIRAAHAAGMLPLMVPDMKAPSAEVVTLAYQVLPSLHALPALLHSLR